MSDSEQVTPPDTPVEVEEEAAAQDAGVAEEPVAEPSAQVTPPDTPVGAEEEAEEPAAEPSAQVTPPDTPVGAEEEAAAQDAGVAEEPAAEPSAQVTPPDTPVGAEEEAAAQDSEEAEEDETFEEDVQMPTGPPPPIPSFPPDFPLENVEGEDLKREVYDGEEEDFVVEQVPYVVGKAAAEAQAQAEETKPASTGTPVSTGDFFIIRRHKKNILSTPIYSIELYDPEGNPESTYRIYAQMTVALKPYFSISGDKEDFGKKREKRSHQFVGKLVVEKAKKIYIGAMQNTEDRTKSHMVSIVYDQKKDEEFVRMEVALTLVPTPTLHDEFMLMRVNQSQNSTRVDELFVLQDNLATDTALSQLFPMKLKGKIKKVPSHTLFALTKTPSKWGEAKASARSSLAEKPEGFIYMQFGKIRESKLYPDETMDTFTIQFQDPVTMVTAFMIMLSRFDCMKI